MQGDFAKKKETPKRLLFCARGMGYGLVSSEKVKCFTTLPNSGA